MEKIIRVHNLKKRFKTRVKAAGLGAAIKSLFAREYKEITAVNNISFEVAKGEILAFIGPNGAGKSTTIKLITGILFPDSGEISLLGMNPHKQRRQIAYRIGTVFGQKSQLWFHLPPEDSFYLLGSIYDIDKKRLKTKIAQLTEIFEIGDFVRQPVRKLSLGQRIRCEMAASLLHEPEILFLDEPSIGLDVVVKQRIRDLIQKINQEEGVTVFLTSHDVGDIEKICKRVIVVNNGEIVRDGSIKEMKYTLLNKRIIDLKLAEKDITLEREGVVLLKAKDYAAKLEVDLNVVSLDTVLQEILQKSAVQDMTIQNIPMEQIIAMIYQGHI